MLIRLISLIRILLDPRITRTPLRVLKDLRRRGIRRLPETVDNKVSRGVPALGLLPFLREWLGSEMLSRHNGQWVLNSFTPPFPGEAFDRAFENLLSGRRYSPISAFCAITGECPNACIHCSVARRRQGHLSIAQWKAAIEGLHGLGTSIIGFTGGEPCMRSDLPELIHSASRGAATILFTSGAGFTADLSTTLKGKGLWSVCISLDAADPESFGRLRGNAEAFDSVVSALRTVRRSGFYTMIGAVASKTFLRERVFEHLLELGRREGVHEIRIVEPMPCGNLHDVDADTLLAPEDLAELRTFHRKVNRRGRLPKICSFNQIESPEFFGCAGGIQHMYIDSAGKVCPCDFTPMSFGNVTREKLETIWTRMTEALRQPKSHCMVQHHRQLFAEYQQHGYPLPPEISLEVCKRMPQEALPRYYAMVGTGTGGEGLKE